MSALERLNKYFFVVAKLAFLIYIKKHHLEIKAFSLSVDGENFVVVHEFKIKEKILLAFFLHCYGLKKYIYINLKHVLIILFLKW